MERQRALAGSPPPTIQKTASAGSLLDSILSRKTMDLSASNNFGLLIPYRTNRKYRPHNLARLCSSVPSSPRLRPASPLALTKSSSAPLERFIAEATGQPLEEESGWKCKACSNTDVSTLTVGADSFLSCPCGVVDTCSKLISQVRSKNCPESEDKTRVADAPVADAHEVAIAALASGPESADARKRRMLSSAGGSRGLSKSAQKKHDLGCAQRNVDQATTRDMREQLEINQRDASKQRAILRVVEAVFDSIHGLDDERIKKHVRLEALRIYGASALHDQKCGSKGCLLCIAARSSALVGTCVVESVFQKLHDGEGVQLAEIAPEVAAQKLQGFLSQTKALQLRNSSANQRLQVLSAVNIISGWTAEQCARACPPPEPPPPAILELPPSMQGSSDYGSGKGKQVDPADRVTCKLRDRVLAASKISPPLQAAVRNAALSALLFKPVVDFLKNYAQDFKMSADVIAICLTMAAARKLKREQPPPPWHKEIYQQNDVVKHTIDALTGELYNLLKDLPEVKDESDLF